MQWVVTCRHRVPQEQLIFFVFDAARVLAIPGVLTTDGNAASNETVFYRGNGALPYLDWRILTTRDCYSPEYKRKKCAEVLVPDWVPRDLITSVHTVDEAGASSLRQCLNLISSSERDLAPIVARVTANPSLYY
jgi:hypothetical protein